MKTVPEVAYWFGYAFTVIGIGLKYGIISALLTAGALCFLYAFTIANHRMWN